MNEARFRFWVRRSLGDEPTFSVRFDVEKGKGLLRIARPGVLVDPPARQNGQEDRLTSAQVRASRFLHVWDAGRKRQGYVLSRLTDEVLSAFPAEAWVVMDIVSEGGFCWLVPGRVEAATASGMPEEAEVYSNPLDEISEVAELQGVEIIEGEPSLKSAPRETDVARLAPQDPGPLPPTPVDARDPYLAVFGRPTTVIRHLRREKMRDALKIVHLEQRVAELEERLGQANAREIELRTRVARYQRRLKALDPQSE